MCVYIVFCSALLLLLSYPVLFGRGYFCVGFSWDSYSTDDFNERAHSKTELCSHFVSLFFCVCERSSNLLLQLLLLFKQFAREIVNLRWTMLNAWQNSPEVHPISDCSTFVLFILLCISFFFSLSVSRLTLWVSVCISIFFSNRIAFRVFTSTDTYFY